MRVISRLALLSALIVVAGLFTGVARAAVIVPATNDATGATNIATAIAANPAHVSSAAFDAHPPFGTPNGTSDALNSFPTNGSTFGILTTGNVLLADDPNLTGSAGTSDGGGNVRGDTDFDVTILRINVLVPQGANCLSFDFKFLSEEHPEYVGTEYNDAFIAELDSSTWTTSGSTISAPNNFAFDPNGNVVSINSTGVASMSAAEAAGTTYDASTALLSASTQVTPGPHTLYLSIFDQGDQILDSAVFLDNLIMGFVPDPSQQCLPGAQPKTFQLTLTPADATNATGTPHTVTATLTETGVGPVSGATISFTVGGTNPTTGTAVTNASGEATFTYTGTAPGDDTITACYDADASGGACGNAGDPIASAAKTWVVVDTTAPDCRLTAMGTDSSGRKYIEVSIRDTGSGLASIQVLKSDNADTVVPPFAPGTTSTVVVRATKINQSLGATVQLRATDVAGNVTTCDPTIVNVEQEGGKPVEQTFDTIPDFESWVTIYNGNPGLNNVTVYVNGTKFKEVGLGHGEQRTIDIASAMQAGDNTVTVAGRGRKGASAVILIHDGSGEL